MPEHVNNEPVSTFADRVICFIDLLGFKCTVDESVKNDELRLELYTMINQLQAHELGDGIYGSIPFFNSDWKMETAKEAGAVAEARAAWPLSITQFSDSFVLSCPADNSGSCALLLATVYTLNRLFFWHLGILMRGGIAMGKLIHEEGGALFGPAMNAAYELESKCAVYPRVLIKADAAEHLRALLHEDPRLKPLFQAFDGHTAVDLVSNLTLHVNSPGHLEEFQNRLNDIEADIQKRSPAALPKIRYLQDRFASNKAALESKRAAP